MRPRRLGEAGLHVPSLVTPVATGRGWGGDPGSQQLPLLWFVSYQGCRCKLESPVSGKQSESSDNLERRASVCATENFQRKCLLKWRKRPGVRVRLPEGPFSKNLEVSGETPQKSLSEVSCNMSSLGGLMRMGHLLLF